jgi:hypothetical protein
MIKSGTGTPTSHNNAQPILPLLNPRCFGALIILVGGSENRIAQLS